MNPILIAFLPGALVGAGLGLFLLATAPRVLRAGDALDRLGDLNPAPETGATTRALSDRIGAWMHEHAPNLPGFIAPMKQLDLLEIPVSRFYAQKLQYAALGFAAPLLIPILFQLTLGFFFPLPLVVSPVLAAVMWMIPDSTVRTRAKQAQREFTRFVTVYLELVAVALLGNTTADSALASAATVSDSWAFVRIRREYQLADLTRTSKWDALDRLGVTIGVPALTEMSRTMRLADARIGLRDQLRAACDKLRAQLAADDTAAAERVTSRMDVPVMLTLAPILAIVITPTLLQLTAM
ncbi:hypothetical protein [Rathayibacter soli]|uniref:hypothetical protein n=1 Tax=Rathayibacter soli TaxID=3144168 RepID=UPI0027E4AA22|nr:hypothetical protein [Glaciibacter superstes]